MEREKVRNIYKTTDYSIFRTLIGNRKDAEKRGRQLMNSLYHFGQLEPVTVNEKMEVIDGQARIYALKKLGMPVEYTIKEGIGINECLNMNNNQNKWTLANYIESHAEFGDQACIYLMALKKQFPTLSYSQIAAIAKSHAHSPHGGGGQSKQIKEGSFRLTEEEYLGAISRMSFIDSLMALFPVGGASKAYYITATAILLLIPEVNKQRLRDSISRNAFLLKPAPSVADAIGYIDKCYNYRLTNKLYIVELYRRFCDENRERSQRCLNG